MAQVNFNGVGSTFMAWDYSVIQARLNELNPPALAKPTALTAFSTLFTDVPAPSGIVSVPIINYPQSASLLTNGIGNANNATASVASIQVTSDIGQFFAFNPSMAQQFGLDNLINSWIQPAIYACDRTLSNLGLGIALGSSFATSSVKVPTASSMSIANTGLINADLSNAGINGDRFAILTPNYYWSLITAIASAGNAAGAAAIQSGSPNNPLNMRVIEGQDVAALASGNVYGFTGVKSAIAVGSALPNVVHANGETIRIVSPNTGVPYLIEKYYDEVNRQWLIGASVIAGAAKIQTTIKQLSAT